MSHKILLYNGQLILGDRILSEGYIFLENGVISSFGKGEKTDIDPKTIRIDVSGKYISPGFIDLHVHGGGGYDFMDCTVEAFLNIANTHVKYGTTSFCPTTLTSTLDSLFLTLDIYKEANRLNHKGSQFLGVHLEGPYFAMNQRGAQDPKHIRNPKPEEYMQILAYSEDIIRWSAAPELPGAIEFAHYVKSKGKIVALAHTDATYEEAHHGFKNGYTLATHFYSAMSGITRKNAFRHAGTIEAGYLIDDMDLEIIADGIHVPPPLMQLVYKIKGSKRIALVTDAMRGAGMPQGESVLGNINDGLAVIIEDGVAKLPDRSAFAGSVATVDRLVRTFMRATGISIHKAVEMVTATPARILGLSRRKGEIAIGKDADIVVFDENINIQYTIVNGNICYQQKIR